MGGSENKEQMVPFLCILMVGTHEILWDRDALTVNGLCFQSFPFLHFQHRDSRPFKLDLSVFWDAFCYLATGQWCSGPLSLGISAWNDVEKVDAPQVWTVVICRSDHLTCCYHWLLREYVTQSKTWSTVTYVFGIVDTNTQISNYFLF